MDAHALRVLEFQRVREMVAARCASQPGRDVALALEPYRDAARIRTSLKQTDETRGLLDAGDPLPVGGIEDIRALLDRAQAQNRPFEPAELGALVGALKGVKELIAFIAKRRESLPELDRLASQFIDHAALLEAILVVIEPPAAVRDNASEKLWELRRAIRSLDDDVRERIQELMTRTRVRDALQSPTISLRNGRYVLPVKVDMKGHVPGMLHDLSASGATAFIEPAEIVPMVNRLREYKLEQTKEERRLLWQLTRQVFDARGPLLHSASLVAWFDFSAAKGRLSKDLGMLSAAPSADGRLRLAGARHPLLLKSTAEAGASSIVPLDVRLREGFRILVITGPNTGGKTVALKTVGLLQLMFQSGMHVPAGPGTVLPMLNGVYADIGDEQSIDQSLSTFSGHIKNVTEILAHADERSLVLLDELGAGTEPSEGAALGTAILDRLREVGASCIVTTHLGSLKEYALAHAEVENASVEFDAVRMQPLYRLLVGQPGNSNALAIAERFGLDPQIIAQARAILAAALRPDHDIVEKLLESRQALEKTRQESEQHLQKSRNLAKAAEERIRHVEKRELRVEREADEVIDETLKTLAERMTPLLRELASVPNALKPAVQALHGLLRDAVKSSSVGEKRREYIATLKKDDQVFVPRFGQLCRVRKFDRQEEKLTVLVGKMAFEIAYDEVSFLDPGLVSGFGPASPSP
jgi:DNA mismatch repair protein MutS2